MKRYLIYMNILLFLLVGCSAEDGEDGAVGTQGPRGEQGMQGPAGQQGEQGVPGNDGQDGINGEDGNANVIASDWIPTDFDSGFTDFTFFSVVDDNITEENIKSAVFFAYARDNAGTIVPLPFVIGFGGNKFYDYRLVPPSNEIFFTGISIDGSNELFFEFSDVRYAIIPSSLVAKNSIDDLKKMDYKKMVNYLKLDY